MIHFGTPVPKFAPARLVPVPTTPKFGLTVLESVSTVLVFGASEHQHGADFPLFGGSDPVFHPPVPVLRCAEPGNAPAGQELISPSQSLQTESIP